MANQNNQNQTNQARAWYQKTSNYYLEFCIMFFLLCVISIALPVAIYSSFNSISGDRFSWEGSLWAGSILLPAAFIFTPLYLRTRTEEAYDSEKQHNVLKLVFVIIFSVITIITALILISTSIYSLGNAIKDSSVNRLLATAVPAFLTSLSLAFLTFAVAKKSKPTSTLVISAMLFVLIFGYGLFSVITGIVSGEKRNDDCTYSQYYSAKENKCIDYNYNNGNSNYID